MDPQISWIDPQLHGLAHKLWAEICKETVHKPLVYELLKDTDENAFCLSTLSESLPFLKENTENSDDKTINEFNKRLSILEDECISSFPDFMPYLAIPTYMNKMEMNKTKDQYSFNLLNAYKKLIRKKKELNKASSFGLNILLDNDPEFCDICPWKPMHIWQYSHNLNGLHLEILDFHKFMSPTPEEREIRNLVVSRLSQLVTTIWPEAKVEVYGSFNTGLYLPTSDIDLVILGSWSAPPLRLLEKVLLDNNLTSEIKVLDRASVPIIKMTDKATSLQVDISFNMKNGVPSANLIKEYMAKYPPLSYLVLVLKQFLLQRDLNEVWTGGISSYSLILMIVSFLQQTESPHNCYGRLLIDFFELYGRHFNYFTTGIRVKDNGRYVPKQEIQKEMENGGCPSILCIEDPLVQGNDIGRSSYGALRVKETFEYAYQELSTAVLPQYGPIFEDSISILARIIHVTREVVRYRDWIKTNYSIICNELLNYSDNLVFIKETACPTGAQHYPRDFPYGEKNSHQSRSYKGGQPPYHKINRHQMFKHSNSHATYRPHQVYYNQNKNNFTNFHRKNNYSDHRNNYHIKKNYNKMGADGDVRRDGAQRDHVINKSGNAVNRKAGASTESHAVDAASPSSSSSIGYQSNTSYSSDSDCNDQTSASDLIQPLNNHHHNS